MDRPVVGVGGLIPPTMMMNLKETKIIYYLDDEDTPYSVKINIPPDSITLRDFKSILALPKTNYKFFFKSSDDDFGIVKEEVADDDSKLPLFKGRVVSYIVTAEGSNLSDGSTSQVTEVSHQANKYLRSPSHRPSNGVRHTPTHYPPKANGSGGGWRYHANGGSCDDSMTCTETEVVTDNR